MENVTNVLLRLLDQSVWANRQWIEYVFSQPEPDERPRRLLEHIVVSEQVWFDRIDGGHRSPGSSAIGKEELLHVLGENRRMYLSLTEARLDDVIHFKRATGEEYHARVLDILLHLLTHGYHHRGQLAAHYAGRGNTYPTPDHIDFLIRQRL
jgi:uncharacterized damage-inducible protein DinB